MNLVLFIPDSALRDAVLEQLTALKLGAVHVAATANDIATSSQLADSLIIADKTPETDNLLKALPLENRSLVLLLGGSDDDEGVTETFAKPLRLGHLMGRIRWYLETAPLLRGKSIAFGPYKLEAHARRVFRDNEPEPIRLTEKETSLLAFLAQSPTTPSRRDILAGVWGYGEGIDTHTLETHVYQLRHKLDRPGENWLIHQDGTYRLAGTSQ